MTKNNTFIDYVISWLQLLHFLNRLLTVYILISFALNNFLSPYTWLKSSFKGQKIISPVRQLITRRVIFWCFVGYENNHKHRLINLWKITLNFSGRNSFVSKGTIDYVTRPLIKTNILVKNFSWTIFFWITQTKPNKYRLKQISP